MVEDNAVDAAVLEGALVSDTKPEFGNTFEVTGAGDLDSALRELSGHAFDVALLDLALPDAHGLQIVEQAQAAAPDLPLVVLTGSDDARLARVAVGSGAQDYLVKGSFGAADLMRTITYAIERKQLQLAQLDEKDRFLSLVSHELRNPLTVINAALEILAKAEPALAGKDAELVEIARKNARHLCTLIDDLVDSAAAAADRLDIRPEPVASGTLVTEVADQLGFFAARRGVTLRASVDNGLADVAADRTRVRQVLVNLTTNALKHTAPGGSVLVEAAAHDSAHVEIRVVDSGCGIAPEHLPHVFDRDFRGSGREHGANGQGLGLGLFVAKTIIDRHGGEIWIDSVIDRGTTAHFTLPVA